MEYIIKKEFSPSKIIKTEVKDVNEVVITCGGGMGGSRWEEYTPNKIKEEDLIKRNFIKLNTNRGKNRIINPDYIVQVNPKKVVHVKYMNMGNPNIKKTDYYYVLNKEDTFKLSETYGDNGSMEKLSGETIDFLN